MMEFFDIVDRNDEVVGKASRQEIYEKKLRHRIIHVLIFDRQNRLALQFRGDKCFFCPRHWSTSVGGHVQSGESYEEAAIREFKEELGTLNKFEFFSKDFFVGETGLEKHLATFKTIYEGPFRLEEGKVEIVEFFSIEKIKQMIANGEKFHPELLFLLKKYFL